MYFKLVILLILRMWFDISQVSFLGKSQSCVKEPIVKKSNQCFQSAPKAFQNGYLTDLGYSGRRIGEIGENLAMRLMKMHGGLAAEALPLPIV